MISALLLPLLFAGIPADSAAQTPADDPAIRIWINNDRRFRAGDRAKVEVRSHDDGYLIVLHADPDGHLRVLFPVDPGDDNFVRGGRKYEVKGRGGHESFHVDVSSGRGTVYAAVSAAPFRFDQFVLGDHWDYRALAPNQLPREPETELTELVRRMAQGNFDYDLLTYDVIERVVYAADRSYASTYYHDSFYYDDPWCGGYYYRHCGSGISVGLFFGRPYRRAFYGPFYNAYDPFYDPFFYDPFYYRPIYRYRPYYYRPYYYGPNHYGPYYGGYYGRYDRGFRHNRPYTPYRFRGSGTSLADYRDRRYDLRRSVNTVYTPPVTRLGEDRSSSPVRRAVERRESSSTGRAEARREGKTVERREPELRRRATPSDGGTPSFERRPIEARRAQNPEREASPRTGGERRDLPREVRGRRQDEDRPSVQRAPERVERQPEARPSQREARPSQPEARPTRREVERAAPEASRAPQRVERGGGGGDRGGGGRVERSAPPPRSSDGGGRRPSGGGGRDGGGRRR